MHEKRTLNITAAFLHILAMVLMLCDHLWAMLFPAAEWLTCAGRIAFPVFAFMLVEGYFHTRNLRRYILRLLICAIVSEIPFNLMYAGSIIYPYHQNVIGTFLIGLLLITAIEHIRRDCRPVPAAAASIGLVFAGFILGYAAMTDYYGVGVLTIFVFYFFRKRTWKNLLCQIFCMYILNVELLGGYYYDVSIMGFEFELVQQGLALLALVPIWMYQGKQGFHGKPFQYFCYVFYPLHMVILFCIREYILDKI